MFIVGQYVHVFTVLGDSEDGLDANIGKIVSIDTNTFPETLVIEIKGWYNKTVTVPANVCGSIKDLRKLVKVVKIKE